MHRRDFVKSGGLAAVTPAFMSKRVEESRLRIVLLDESAFVDAFNLHLDLKVDGRLSRLTFPDGIKLPKDARVKSIYYDNRRRAWAAVVHSEEFDRVEPGCELPIHSEHPQRVVAVRLSATVDSPRSHKEERPR